MLARMRRKRISFALLVGMQVGAAALENSLEFPQKIKNRTTLWGLSRLSIRFPLRSWFNSSWGWAPCWALCWQLRAWSLLRILCLPLSLPFPCLYFRSLKNEQTSLIIREIQIKTTRRYHLTPVKMDSINNSGNNRCWQGCGERWSLLHCWWQCKLVQPLWKTVWRFLKKLKIEPPYDPAIAQLGIYPWDTGVLFQRDTCTPMFIAALSTIAKVWKEPKCPSMDEWIRKMWYIYIQWGITWQSKRMKSCHLQWHGWNWRVLC